MTDQNIKILSDREHVLLRPGMYIGSTKPETQKFWIVENNSSLIKEIEYIPGQFKLFCEILDNAIDEHVRGYGNKIDVEYDTSSGEFSVRDYGRGIPIENHKEAKVPTPEVVFTHLRSGSNFDDTNRETVGMNGVGASLVTIFSKRLCLEIVKGSKKYSQCYSDNMKKIGIPSILKTTEKESGTKVTVELDSNIFSINIPSDLIKKRCFELVQMFPKLSISLKINHSIGDVEEYSYKSTGFEDFLKYFNSEYSIYEDAKLRLKLGICYNDKTENFEQYSNVNGADTWRGGTHIDYFRELFCEDIKEKIKKENKLIVANSDIAKNMILVVFLNINAPTYEGQTKEKLVTDKKEIIQKFDSSFSSRKITSLTANLNKIKESTIDDVTLKMDKKLLLDIKKKHKELDRKRIPKLIECSSKNREECSIYITEGDSAISNLAMVRNAKTMAGLPLKGKVMNVLENSLSDIIENKEIQAIVASIGLKFGEEVDKKNLAYGKIIIATDQDMDGYAIRCLLINLFYKFWPELFKQQRVFILESPLYEALSRKNKSVEYFYDKAGFESWAKNKNLANYEISYFKGLGSCGEDAWNYMINTNPNLVSIDDNDADLSKKMLSLVFGKDSDKRKEWLTR